MIFNKGDKIALTKNSGHGDYKSVCAFPDRWPLLQEGTVVEFVETWTNLIGDWARVQAPNGSIYDIKPHHLGKKL